MIARAFFHCPWCAGTCNVVVGGFGDLFDGDRGLASAEDRAALLAITAPPLPAPAVVARAGHRPSPPRKLPSPRRV